MYLYELNSLNAKMRFYDMLKTLDYQNVMEIGPMKLLTTELLTRNSNSSSRVYT